MVRLAVLLPQAVSESPRAVTSAIETKRMMFSPETDYWSKLKPGAAPWEPLDFFAVLSCAGEAMLLSAGPDATGGATDGFGRSPVPSELCRFMNTRSKSLACLNPSVGRTMS